MRGRSGRQASNRKHYDGPASRAKILALVGDDPGIHVDELADQAALSWHTTAYHLSILERTGKVAVEKGPRDRCVFLRQVPARHRPWLVAMRAEPAHAIARALMESPRQSVPNLARRLGLSEKVVRRRVADLEAAGVLARAGAWRPLYEVKRSVARPLALLLSDRRPSHAARNGRRPTGASRPAWTDVQASLAGGLGFGTWEWLPKTDKIAMSDAGWRICGLPGRREGTSRAFVEHVHDMDRPGLETFLATALTRGSPYDHTVRVLVEGRERLVRHRGRVTAVDERGRPVRLAGTVEEVEPRPGGVRVQQRTRQTTPAGLPVAPDRLSRAMAWLVKASRAGSHGRQA